MKRIFIFSGLLLISLVVGLFLLVKVDPGFLPGWSTYSNEVYGYKISYPAKLVKVNTPTNTFDRELSDFLTTDPLVVLKDMNDGSDEIATIAITVLSENQEALTFDSIDVLQKFYRDEVISKSIENAVANASELSEDDFSFAETTFAKKRAFIVAFPGAVEIMVLNNNNQAVAISLPTFDNSDIESSDKRENTERVLSTFRFVD